MKNIIYLPIRIINTPHKIAKETPTQPVYAKRIKGTDNVFPEYPEGTNNLDEFPHIYLIYRFNKSTKTKLKAKPFLDNSFLGLFSTNLQFRNNFSDFSFAKSIKLKDNTLFIEDIDILNETPLLDIKPSVHKFNTIDKVKCG